jgi:hypothetical protein
MTTELTNLRRARTRAHLKLKQAETLVADYQVKLAGLKRADRQSRPSYSYRLGPRGRLGFLAIRTVPALG